MTWIGYRNPAERIQAATGAHPPPLPLDDQQALNQALEHRHRGWRYVAISQVMGYYHGHWASDDAWRYRIHAAQNRTSQ